MELSMRWARRSRDAFHALGNPNAVLGAANFGSITTAGDPRVAQLAVKLVF